MTARGSLVSLAAVLLLVGDPRLAAAQYPIFDAHIHYSRPDWDAYPPERALAILAQAGVARSSRARRTTARSGSTSARRA